MIPLADTADSVTPTAALSDADVVRRREERDLLRLVREHVRAGANPADRTTLTSFRRGEPYHGTSPYWRANLSTETRGWFAANGRFAYTAGRRGFLAGGAWDGRDATGEPGRRAAPGRRA